MKIPAAVLALYSALSSASATNVRRASKTRAIPSVNSVGIFAKEPESMKRHDHSAKTRDDRYLVDIPTETLSPGVPVSVTLDGESIFSWSYAESDTSSYMFCKMSPVEGTQGGGDADLRILDGDTGEPVCATLCPGATGSCVGLPSMSESGLIVEAFAYSGSNFDVTLLCESRVIEDISVGTDIPISMQAYDMQYLSYTAEDDSVLECNLSGDNNADADLMLGVPDDKACLSMGSGPDEVCSVQTGIYSGPVFALVRLVESRGKTQDFTLRCNAGLIAQLILGTFSISLEAGEVLTYTYESEIDSILTCRLGGPQNTTGVAALSIEYDTTVVNDNDVPIVATEALLDDTSIPKPSSTRAVVSISSLVDETVDWLIMDCSLDPIAEESDAEAEVARRNGIFD